MRIAQIAPPWFAVPPGGYGGVELVVALLCDGLAERGHEVTLFAAPGSHTKAALVSPLGYEPPRGSIGDEWIGSVHAVAAYQQADRFDLIHDHTMAIGPAVGSFAPRPVVHTLHGAFHEHARRLAALLAGRLWFVAISASQRSLAPPGLRWAGVVHNGLALDRYRLSTEKDDFLLFVGRTNPEKAPDLAIRAARQAGRRLVMVVKTAEPRERRYWAERVEPLLGDDVEVLADVSHERKVELLGRAAAVLVPIQWPEPFGLVLVEAMACGTPVVGWRNGSVPELVADGETGFVVDSLDGMVAALDRLDRLDPHVLRAAAERRFSAAAMVDAYQAVYRRVAPAVER